MTMRLLRSKGFGRLSDVSCRACVLLCGRSTKPIDSSLDTGSTAVASFLECLGAGLRAAASLLDGAGETL